LFAIVETPKEFKELPSLDFLFLGLSSIRVLIIILVIILFWFVFGIRVVSNEGISEGQKVFIEDDFVKTIYSLIIFIL
jgi:hypothetical protein